MAHNQTGCSEPVVVCSHDLLRLTHVLHVCLLNQGAHCPTRLPGEKCLFWCSILYQTFLLQSFSSFSQSCLVSPSMQANFVAGAAVIGRTPVRQRNSRSCLTVAWQLDLTWPDVANGWKIYRSAAWWSHGSQGSNPRDVVWALVSCPSQNESNEWASYLKILLYIVSCKIIILQYFHLLMTICKHLSPRVQAILRNVLRSRFARPLD